MKGKELEIEWKTVVQVTEETDLTRKVPERIENTWGMFRR